jgi:GNAT superfamily N-acetyltransferase
MTSAPTHLLREAAIDDLSAVASLREAVGWAAHDWALRAVIGQPHATCLVAEDAGRVVAVGSGISYGALGFVGNMVVAPSHRRRGLGSAILMEVTTFLERAGCRRLELYATAEGRALYERHGFALDHPTTMAHIPRHAATAHDSQLELLVAGPAELDALSAYDRARFGADRRPLLELMLADRQRPLLLALRDDAIGGYLWLRPESSRIGPWLADTPDLAGVLLAAAFERATECDELAAHLSTANAPGVAWLRRLGVETAPWDGHMARGASVRRRHDTIYGNVVGALG